MVSKGKDCAMENLEKSNVAFIGKLADAKKEWISSSIPPIDHYILKFDQSNLVTLRGRIYEKMKQFQYQQKGAKECVLPDADDVEAEQIAELIPTKPVVGNLYLACITDNLAKIEKLILLEQEEIDEVIRKANERRKSCLC